VPLISRTHICRSGRRIPLFIDRPLHGFVPHSPGAAFSVLLTLCLACSPAPPPDDASSPADARTGDVDALLDAPVCVPFKLTGQPCDHSCECLGGLCLLNEYAPFRFCSRPCPQGGSFCEPDKPGGTYNALCVDFPSDFRVQPDRFCAPLCESQVDCLETGSPWETCEQPAWKGNLLYATLPDKVCISPSAQGHDPVDPDTCQGWEELFNQFAQERLACLGYCEFLDACQHLPASKSPPCCAFGCMSLMVDAKGNVDEKWFKTVRCYFDEYQAFDGTALVCSKPLDVCGEKPTIP